MNFLMSLLISSTVLVSCNYPEKKYITVYLPSEFCGDLYIVPDKNSLATSNEIHVDSTGLYLINYGAAATFDSYELRILQNGQDISDECAYFNSVYSPKGGDVIYKKIKIPCENQHLENNNQREFSELIKGINIKQ
jgi:hypothetical protein